MKKSYTIGWSMGAVAYAFPLVVGSLWFLQTVPSMLTGGAPYRPLVHIGLVNLIYTGFSGIVICCYGLRLRIPAFWYLHLVFLLWVVSNDLYAAVRANWLPMPLVPGTLGAVSLALTFSCVRGSRSRPANAQE